MKTVAPESVGLSAEHLAYIDAVMADAVVDDKLPGIMTLVQRRGEVAHFGMYGMMDIEAQRPMQEDALFRIYSMTKPITSIALMMLVEEGKVTLRDMVAQYIPAFGKTPVYNGMTATGMQTTSQNPPMTIYHLMNHTSGLSYGFFFDNPVEDLYRQRSEQEHFRDVSLADSVAHLASLPLLFQPGTRWNYSTATYVIGHLVEIISGMPLADFLQDRIFEPLGMVDTAFDVPADKVERLAQIYTSEGLYDPVPITPDEVMGIGNVTTPTHKPLGDAGLVSTIADYRRFATCLLNWGELDGFRLLSPRTLDWMVSDHLLSHMMPIHIGFSRVSGRFGLGFRVVTDLGDCTNMATIGEFGWSGAAQTTFIVAPAEDMIMLFMTQHLPMAPYNLYNRFTNMAYQAIMD